MMVSLVYLMFPLLTAGTVGSWYRFDSINVIYTTEFNLNSSFKKVQRLGGRIGT